MIDRNRRYTSDEVAEIVRESLLASRADQQAELTHADLEDISRQCGVDQAALHRTLQNRELESAKRVIRRRWRTKALANLAAPFLICLVCIGWNIQNGGFPWAIFPVVFWLLPAVTRSRSRLLPSDELLTKSARRFRSAYSAQ